MSRRLAPLAIVLLVSACASGWATRNRAASVKAELARARTTSVYSCAPEELAEADARYEITRVKLEEGRAGDAEDAIEAAQESLAKAFERCGMAVKPKAPGPADADGDGVADADDLCPALAGPSEHHGCPDPDGDGIFSDIDRCPADPEDKDGFLDEDGCPDWDNDADGIADAQDACPNDAGPLSSRGCPDRDGDGVADADDKCPDEAGPAESPKGPGCPGQKYKLVIKKKDRIEIAQKIQFKTGSGVILKESYAILEEVAQVMKDFPTVKIQVEGHTDAVGSAKVNRKLSKWRAAEVFLFLAKQGVAKSRMLFDGYGPDRPLQPNTTATGREANRRVEFVITSQ